MIIVDTALKARHADNNPIRVALIGAGFQGRGIALKIISSTPGMVLAGVANRNLAQALDIAAQDGLDA